MINPTLNTIKRAIRDKFVWPGGHAVVLITDDGETLCAQCSRECFREICRATKKQLANGWQVTGVDHAGHYEETPVCDHCGKDIA